MTTTTAPSFSDILKRSYDDLQQRLLADYMRADMILVTHLVKIIAKVECNGKIYLLVPHAVWYCIVQYFEEYSIGSKPDMSMRTMITSAFGIPVREDEELVRNIIVDCWKYAK